MLNGPPMTQVPWTAVGLGGEETAP
jgi:hypothetical protein